MSYQIAKIGNTPNPEDALCADESELDVVVVTDELDDVVDLFDDVVVLFVVVVVVLVVVVVVVVLSLECSRHILDVFNSNTYAQPFSLSLFSSIKVKLSAFFAEKAQKMRH